MFETAGPIDLEHCTPSEQLKFSHTTGIHLFIIFSLFLQFYNCLSTHL